MWGNKIGSDLLSEGDWLYPSSYGGMDTIEKTREETRSDSGESSRKGREDLKEMVVNVTKSPLVGDIFKAVSLTVVTIVVRDYTQHLLKKGFL